MTTDERTAWMTLLRWTAFLTLAVLALLLLMPDPAECEPSGDRVEIVEGL